MQRVLPCNTSTGACRPDLTCLQLMVMQPEYFYSQISRFSTNFSPGASVVPLLGVPLLGDGVLRYRRVILGALAAAGRSGAETSTCRKLKLRGKQVLANSFSKRASEMQLYISHYASPWYT